MRARMDKQRKDLNDAIEAVLTSDQKSALKRLAGTKKFVEQPRPQGFGGPGGPGGRGPGGPGGQGGPPPDGPGDEFGQGGPGDN